MNFLATVRTSTRDSRGHEQHSANRSFNPRGRWGGIVAWFHQSSPVGTYCSTAHTVNVEQDAHPNFNRLVTHVSLVDETGRGNSLSSVIKVQSFMEKPKEGDQSHVGGFREGTFLQTPQGRQIEIREALALLDEAYTQREERRAVEAAEMAGEEVTA